MTALALTLRGVQKAYGKTRALCGLDLEVPRGALVGLIGPNGAGKTTTFGIVGGTVRADAGQVDVLGGGPFDSTRHAGRVGLLPQDSELNPHTPVRDLLRFFARLQGLGRRDATVEADRVLALVDLRDRATSRIRQLSHGMRRRVAVAQALLGSPELVLLDEPTCGLDPDLVVRMRELLARERGRRTLVVSSHVLADLEAICDHVVFLEAGRVTHAGPIAEVTGRGELVRYVLDGPPPLEALRTALPEIVAEADGASLLVRVPAGQDVATLNERLVPWLFEAGARLLEIRRGRSLESAYMERRESAGVA